MRIYDRENIERVIAYVMKDPGAGHRIGQLCGLAYMGETKFKSAFKAYTGEAFHRWLVQQRMLLAKDLLEDSELSLKQVAKKSG